MSWTYEIQYLGGAMLTRPATTTGLGMIQQPLIDMYVNYFQPKKSKHVPPPLPVRRITMTDRGVIISALEVADVEQQDAFLAMPSIVFWEAVRFVSVRVGDKKYRGAFEPLGEGSHVAKDNLYAELDKRHLHLASEIKQHPVLLACVLRRTSGIKSLDLHVFVCSTPRLGVSIVETFRLAQESYANQQTNISTTFSYNAFEKGTVRQIDGLQIIDTVSVSSGARIAGDLQRTRQPVTSQQPGSRDDMHLKHTCHDGVSRGVEQPMVAASCVDLSSGFQLTQADVISPAPRQLQQQQQQRKQKQDGQSTPHVGNGRPVGRSVTTRDDPRSKPSATNRGSMWMDDQQVKGGRHHESKLDRTRSMYVPADHGKQFESELRMQGGDLCAPVYDVPPKQPQDVRTDRGAEFDFHFGASPETPSDTRPVALVVPRKVQGVRVFPSEMGLSGAQLKPVSKPIDSNVDVSPPAPIAQHRKQTPSPIPRVDIQPSASNIVTQSPALRTDKSLSIPTDGQNKLNLDNNKPVGTLREHLKNCSGANKQPSASDMAARMRDFNCNFKPSSAETAPAMSSTRVGFESLSVGDSGLQRSNSPRPAGRSTVYQQFNGEVQAAGQNGSTKDKEIASVASKIEVDTRCEDSTLAARGTNFEKCLGYFP